MGGRSLSKIDTEKPLTPLAIGEVLLKAVIAWLILCPGYTNLLRIAEQITLTITHYHANTGEEQTGDQTKSCLWFHMRAGKITTSKLKSVCCTSSEVKK